MPAWSLLDGVQGVHVIGWLVTLVGFVVAAWVAGRGWKKTADAALRAQERRRELDDENSRKILRDSIWEGLGTAVVFMPLIIEQLKAGKFLIPQVLGHLDEGRRSYDRQKDNMVHWLNQKEKVRVQVWFRDAAVWRSYLDQYVEPPLGVQEAPVNKEVVAVHIKALETALGEARGIYEELDLPRVHPGQVGYEKWPHPSAHP